MASAFDRNPVDMRPTPKDAEARENKTSGSQGKEAIDNVKIYTCIYNVFDYRAVRRKSLLVGSVSIAEI